MLPGNGSNVWHLIDVEISGDDVVFGYAANEVNIMLGIDCGYVTLICTNTHVCEWHLAQLYSVDELQRPVALKVVDADVATDVRC